MKLKRIGPRWPEYPGNYRTDEAPARPSEKAREYCGPGRGVCAVCGGEISSYESRCYGEAGAAHVWDHSGIAKPATCITAANRHKFPYFYTDG